MTNIKRNLADKLYLCGDKVVTPEGLYPLDFVYKDIYDLADDFFYKWCVIDLQHTAYRRRLADGTYQYAVHDPQIKERITKVTPHTLLWSENHATVYSEQLLYTEFYHSLIFRRYGISSFAVWCNEMGYDPLWYIRDDVQFVCLKDIPCTNGVISKGSTVILQGTRNAHMVDCIVIKPQCRVEHVYIKDITEVLDVL